MKNLPSFIKTYTLILAFAAAVYLPALLIPYYYHDDIGFLFRTPWSLEPHITFDFNLGAGRLFSAYLSTFLGWFVNRESDILIIRWIMTLQVSLIAYMFARLLKPFGWNPQHIFWSSVILCCLAPFQSQITFCAIGVIPTAELLALYAAYLFISPKRNWVRLLNASLFIFMALLIYPPGAMVYWAAAVFILLKHRKHLRDILISGTIPLILYGIYLKYGTKTHLDSISGIYNPHHWETHWIDKGIWFIQRPLHDSFGLWMIYRKEALVLFCVTIILSAGLLRVIHALQRKESLRTHIFIPLALIISGWTMSYLPNLATSARAPWLRTETGLFLITAGLFLFSLRYIIQTYAPKKKQDPIFTTCLIALSIIAGITAQHQITRYRVIPSIMELHYIEGLFRNTNFDRIEAIYFRTSDDSQLDSINDEFGIISSNFNNSLGGAMYYGAAYTPEGRQLLQRTFLYGHGASDEPIPYADNLLIIDTTPLLPYLGISR